MNDFTKEELIEIKGWADYSVGSGLCYTETEPLYTKIQSMIDNYQECDHAWVEARNAPLDPHEGVTTFFICIRCQLEVDK